MDDLIFSLICIYRLPNDNIDIFINGLDLFLSQINVKFLCIFSGDNSDINTDIMKSSNNSNDYLNIMARNGYLSSINNFTTETNSSKTCIDHIFVNNCKSHKIRNAKNSFSLFSFDIKIF